MVFFYNKWVKVLEASLLQVCLNIINVKLKATKMNKQTLNNGVATDKIYRYRIPKRLE